MKALIIGGGIMGSSIAVELANAGVKVTLLERSIPGAEASSAAAGMLAPQLEAHTPGPFLELCMLSRSLYPAWSRQLEQLSGLSIDYVESGSLQLAFSEAETQAIEASVKWQRSASLRAELLTAAQARELEPELGPQVRAAARYWDDHQCDPRKLMRALTIAATRCGVTFRTGTVRTILEDQGRAVGVDLDGERVEADLVVLAAGSWSGLVTGAKVDSRHIKPARGQMVELQLRAPITRSLLKSPTGYLVPRADGRVVCGSTMELVGYDKSVTADGILRILSAATQMVPALAQAALVSTWAGLRPWTEDKLPVLGEGPLENLVMATGHFRNGILLAPITARVVGQLLRREKPQVDLNPFRYSRFSP